MVPPPANTRPRRYTLPMHRLVHRVVLACLLMLLPLQWSAAAAAWYGSHAMAQSPEHLLASAGMTSDAADADSDTLSSLPGPAEEDHACTPDCHLDDPLWFSVDPVRLPPQHAGPPHFDYFAPTGSHIPAGPERPDRQRAA
jgi:hypothetical protein